MAIGVTAPFVLMALIRRPGFAGSSRFVAWNLAGILDLTVAVSIGALVPLLAPSLYGTVFNDSYDAAALGADSDIPGTDVPDPSLDCVVSGEAVWRAWREFLIGVGIA